MGGGLQPARNFSSASATSQPSRPPKRTPRKRRLSRITGPPICLRFFTSAEREKFTPTHPKNHEYFPLLPLLLIESKNYPSFRPVFPQFLPFARASRPRPWVRSYNAVGTPQDWLRFFKPATANHTRHRWVRFFTSLWPNQRLAGPFDWLRSAKSLAHPSASAFLATSIGFDEATDFAPPGMQRSVTFAVYPSIGFEPQIFCIRSRRFLLTFVVPPTRRAAILGCETAF
jgi:hypothetical protein